MSRGIGSTQKKLMIILLGGTSMALASSPLKQYEIMTKMKEEWEKINNQSLKRSLYSLCKSELILKKVDKKGEVIFSLTEKGVDLAEEVYLGETIIKRSKKWDKKWRIVMFDIPEEFRSARDAVRYRLNKIGFIELQRSVFIYPLDCFHLISKIARLYKIESFFHFVVADSIDKEDKFKNHFKDIIKIL